MGIGGAKIKTLQVANHK